MREKRTIDKLFLFFIIFLDIYLFLQMNSYFNMGGIGEKNLLLIRIILIVYVTFGLLLKRKILISRPLKIATFFWAYSLIGVLISYGNVVDLVKNFVTISVWFFSFLFFLVFIPEIQQITLNRVIKVGIISFFIYSGRFALWLFSENRYWSAGGINSIYYCLALFLFIYLSKNKIINMIMIITISLLTIVSAKRTAFIVLVICIIGPVIFLTKKKQKVAKRIKMIIILAIASCILGVFLQHVSKTMNITIFERFSTLQEDGGSGRVDTYELVWKAFKNSTVIEQIFGHGFNAVFLDKVSVSSAHNDFLEVLYDFGILGFFMYILLMISFCQYTVILYKKRSNLFSIYIATLCSYIIISMASHLIIYPTYIVFLLLFISFGISETRVSRSVY